MRTNKLLQHTALYSFGRGLPGVINLFGIVIYTRWLTPVEYGQYILVIAGIGLANIVFFEWLMMSLLRFFPAYRNHSKALISTIVQIFLYLMLITGLIALVICYVFGSEHDWIKFAFIALFILWAQAWNNMNLVLAQSSLNPINYSLVAICRAIISIGLGALLIYFSLGVLGALIGLFVGYLTPNLVFGRKEWQKASFHSADKAIAVRFFKYGVPLSATRIVTMVVDDFDRYFIAILIGTGAAGLYAAGYNIAQQSLGVLMAIIVTAGYPLVVRALEESGIKKTQEQLRQYIVLFLLVAVPAATGLAMLAPNIAQLFLGVAFRQTAIEIIPIIAIATLIGGIKAHYFDFSFQLGNHTISQVWIGIVMAVVNVVLNIWWIPAFGIIGAAYATVAVFGMGLVLSVITGKNIYRLPTEPKEVLKIVVSSILMAAILWPIHLLTGIGMFIAQVLIGCLAYGVFIMLFNVSNIRRKYIKSI